jgi:hypothetical protein
MSPKDRGRRRTKLNLDSVIARMWQLWRDWIPMNRRALSWPRIDRILLARFRAASRTDLIRAGLLAAFGFVLVWLVISSYATYQADVARDTALDLDALDFVIASQDAAPHADSTTTKAGRAPDVPRRTPADLRDQLRARAEGALLRDSLNARALRVLGQLADATGDEAHAKAFMEAAAHRSLRESIAVYYLMRKSYEHKDFADTAYYADALLRTRPQLVQQVTPILARMAENGDGANELKKLLDTNPPWRTQFFSALPYSISDVRTPLYLLLHLKETATPATANDLRSYLNFLIKHKFYDVAYYTWLQFLPPEELGNVGFLFNADFERPPSGLPFDWVINRGSGVTVDIVARPDEPQKRALSIEFGYGRIEFPGVYQLMMLTPGTYRFVGRYKGRLMGRRGLVWRITCAAGDAYGAAIGQSSMMIGTAPDWKEFDFSFTVPRSDCRAQYIGLFLDARSASEQFVSGSVWYGDLAVSRLEKVDKELLQ